MSFARLCSTVFLVFMFSDWYHDHVVKWKHFPRYWPFVRGIHRSAVNSPHKGQWRGALMFSLICARINSWINSREAGDLRRHRAHDDVTVTRLQTMAPTIPKWSLNTCTISFMSVYIWPSYITLLIFVCLSWSGFHILARCFRVLLPGYV